MGGGAPVDQGSERVRWHRPVDIDNRTVKCDGIDILREESTPVPGIPVAIDNADAATIVIRWTVTGSGVQHRFSGTVTVPVTASTLPLGRLTDPD